jgi:hypothetical protein
LAGWEPFGAARFPEVLLLVFLFLWPISFGLSPHRFSVDDSLLIFFGRVARRISRLPDSECKYSWIDVDQ